MATIFKYKNKIYQALNLDKKLKRLKISINDIDIIFEGNLSQDELEKKFAYFTNPSKKETEYEDPNRLYYFINKETGYSITSINPVCNESGYEPTTLETLENHWHKARKV